MYRFLNDKEPGLEPGDIIIVLDEKEHSLFKRNGIDLIMKMDINITEALCGFKKLITTLDNRSLVIQTIPGKFQKSINMYFTNHRIEKWRALA